MADVDRDTSWMRRALGLAAQGLGRVEPNPMVGAVVVRGDQVVGEGFHARFGGPHAEVVAIQAAGNAARDAELFVTLEPCCHHGKTPPCTDAIAAAGVRRVVAAVTDPFPDVSGRGLATLEAAGIHVDVGVLEAEARHLNGAFFKRQATGLPLVIAKWAMTLDGRIATETGDSRWISCEASRRRVHEIRRVSDAVLVGSGTALADEPSLTVRHVDPLRERGQPTRVVLDDGLVLRPDCEPARTARDVPVLVFTTPASADARPNPLAALRDAGCEVVAVEAGAAGVSAREVLTELGRRGLSRVLVEGGARVFGSFFADGLVDRAMVFVSPRVLGSERALGPVAGPDGRSLVQAAALADVAVSRVGEDLLIEGRVGQY